MNVSFFDNRRVRQILTIIMLFGALTCIFPPMHPSFHWWAKQAVFVALGYLCAGLFFLIINNPRLMFVCLGCSAAICFFKNELGEPSVGSGQSIPASYSTGAPGEDVTGPDSTRYQLSDTLNEPFKTH